MANQLDLDMARLEAELREAELNQNEQDRARLRNEFQQAEANHLQARQNQIANIVNSSKIPETIKSLPLYSGDQKSLIHWITQAQSVVDAYRQLHNNPIWNLWLQAIRTKVTGEAIDALVLNNVGNNWQNIRETLIEYFGDRRDLSSLCQSIPYLRQKSKKMEEFYHEVSELQAKINQKINLVPQYQGHIPAVTHFASQLVKDAFIDGLNNPYSAYTRNSQPQTLVEAYQTAQRQVQADERKSEKFSLANSFISKDQQNVQAPRQKSQNNFRRTPQQFQSRSPQQNPRFLLQKSPQYPQQQRFSGPQPQTPRPWGSHPQSQPQTPQPQSQQVEQMEVDQSIRSRQSGQPMSISQRYRPAQVSNTEQTEQVETAEQEEEFHEEFDDTEFAPDETNFHLLGTETGIK